MKRNLLLLIIALAGCASHDAERTTRVRAAVTATTPIYSAGTFSPGWSMTCCAADRNANSMLMPYQGQPTITATFTSGADDIWLSKPSVALDANDAIEFDYNLGANTKDVIGIHLKTFVKKLAPYCGGVVIGAGWVHCVVPVTALGGAQTVDFIPFENSSTSRLQRAAWTNIQIRDGGTGGALGTGGAPGTGGAATGGSATGGSQTGGSPTGGAATGGALVTGGAATGGVATGGDVATGGVQVTGGANATGGTPATGMPRLGVGRPAFASSGTARLINDGLYRDPYAWQFSGCSLTTPCWVAINVGQSPAKLLVQWSWEDSNAGDFVSSPTVGAYTFAVSSDSTNGIDGAWAPGLDATSGQPVAVNGNHYIYRAHVLQFTGNTWIKMLITSPASGQLDELDLWDATNGTADSYFFHGDSITNLCSKRGGYEWGQPSFQADVQTASPGRYPQQVGGGIISEGALDAVTEIGPYLAAFPTVKYWFNAMGTNDRCWTSPADYAAALQTWVTAVLNAGRTPILVHPFWGNNVSAYCSNVGPAYNTAIDGVVAANGLLPAVPMYEGTYGHAAWFDSGDVHPNWVGCDGINHIYASYLAAQGL